MTQAHDNWGSLYDYVYEQTYGDFYRDLTVETLDQINQILSSGTIIDYGAGTGRLSIPCQNMVTKYSFNRQLELITNAERDVYTYREQCSGIFNEKEFSYTDEFKIRYWDMVTLDKLLKENGLMDTLKTFPKFHSTGSTYKLYQKL
jgi:hypothetical protein